LIIARPQKLTRRLQQHLAKLPIFPLYRVQLFPRALLPLYIFEPRYRELTAHCLRSGGTMAIASLLPGFREDYQGRPPIRRTAGVGRIVAHRRNPDGTYNILLFGMARIRIETELPPLASFREVRAEQLFDHWPSSYDPSGGERTLTALVQKLSLLLPKGGPALVELTKMARTPGELTDVLSASLLSEPRLRLRLLHTCDVAQRIDLVSDALMRLIAELQSTPPSERN
jgi:Lon protease-like protein